MEPRPVRRPRPPARVAAGMAKDTEKLIRQLSLISYLMAERRPVTAPEIRRDVEGYSVMNEDAFARRFYADRSELEALGIVLAVEKPVDGLVEQENYSLPPENFHLPADRVHRHRSWPRCSTALQLLDGEFAYAEPLRLALQQISWGRPSPLAAPEQSTVALGITGSAGGHEVVASGWPRSRPRSSAARRSCSTTTRWSATRSARARSTPTSCSTRAASSTSSAARTSATRSASSGCRGSRARSATRPRPSTTSSAPTTSTRAATPTGSTGSSASPSGTAEVWISERIAWQIERHFGRYGEIRPAGDATTDDRLFVTPYANARQLIAWVLGPGRERPDRPARPSCVAELRERVGLLVERHSRRAADRRRAARRPAAATPTARRADRPARPPRGRRRRQRARSDAAIRPERFARLVTLASILIEAGRAGRPARRRRAVRAR